MSAKLTERGEEVSPPTAVTEGLTLETEQSPCPFVGRPALQWSEAEQMPLGYRPPPSIGTLLYVDGAMWASPPTTVDCDPP